MEWSILDQISELHEMDTVDIDFVWYGYDPDSIHTNDVEVQNDHPLDDVAMKPQSNRSTQKFRIIWR